MSKSQTDPKTYPPLTGRIKTSNFNLEKKQSVETIQSWFWLSLTIPLVAFFAFIGIGLSGSLINIDLILGDVVDEDEYVTGSRSEGGYWGVTAFFMRLAVILVLPNSLDQ